MAEYVKTVVSALSSRSSDYSSPHVFLNEATQTQTDEKVVRIDGRLEAQTTVGTSTLYSAVDYVDLSLQGLTSVNTFILHNRSDYELLLQCYILQADLSGSTIGVCTFSSNNQIDSAVDAAFTKGFQTGALHATHLNTYGAKTSNNNDFAAITSISASSSGSLNRIVVSGTPFGTNEAEDASGHSTTLGIQLFTKSNFYVPAGGVISLPGQLAKIKANIASLQEVDHEIRIQPGFTAVNSKTGVTSPIDYTIFMSGTVG